MLPDVDANDEDVGQEGIVAGSGDGLDTLVREVIALRNQIGVSLFSSKFERTYEPSSTRALNASGSSTKLFLKVIEGAEGRKDGGLERFILQDPAVTLALGWGR